MSIQYHLLRAEMEVNPILQNVIAAHHIIQVANLVFGIIICGATSHFLLMMIHLAPILPALVFLIFWIASKCNYQNLRAILVHFNFILSMLWLITVLPVFILSIIMPMAMSINSDSRHVDVAPIVVAILNGILSLSYISLQFAQSGGLPEMLFSMQNFPNCNIAALPSHSTHEICLPTILTYKCLKHLMFYRRRLSHNGNVSVTKDQVQMISAQCFSIT